MLADINRWLLAPTVSIIQHMGYTVKQWKKRKTRNKMKGVITHRAVSAVKQGWLSPLQIRLVFTEGMHLHAYKNTLPLLQIRFVFTVYMLTLYARLSDLTAEFFQF
jgi:hypothetical protein